LPIVESMACGTPVITSNNSSMQEIGGDSALLVSPHSTDEIAEAMYRIASDTQLQTKLREDGMKRAATFTWHNTAQRYLDIYERKSPSLRKIA